MSVFSSSHFASAAASGEDWRETSRTILEKLEFARKNLQTPCNFGFIYISDHLTKDATSILNLFRSVLGIENWVGSVGIGVLGVGEAFINRPAISVLIGHFPENHFCVFPQTKENFLGSQERHTSQDKIKDWLKNEEPMLVFVHGDPMAEEDPAKILGDLERLTSGFIVGGLSSSRSDHAQIANVICKNTVCGVFFSRQIPVATTLSQGCEPISSFHAITRGDANIIYELDGRNALTVLQENLLKKAAENPDYQESFPPPDLRSIRAAEDIPEEFKALFENKIHIAFPISQSDQKDYLVRNITGINATDGAITVSQNIVQGSHILFVRRDNDTVMKDLSRALLALRDRVKGKKNDVNIKGALYVSCAARGVPEKSGHANPEMNLVREILGDIPLAGFYAGGEINNARLYGYTGVLTLFL